MQSNKPKESGLKGAWRRFDHRFYIGRWIILILLTLVLFTCTYYTIKVKTSMIIREKKLDHSILKRDHL